MATVYGERTDGCDGVGCLAIVAYPEEAAATRRRMARDGNLPERAGGLLAVAARVLGLDPATPSSAAWDRGGSRISTTS